MSKLLNLTVLMLLLTLTSNGQKALPKNELETKYADYKESTFPFTKLTYDEWKAKNHYVEIAQVETQSGQSEALKKLIPPGTYLIRAKNQILFGFGCQVLAGGVVAAGVTSDNSNAIYIGAGALSLVGLGLELSGIVNIGKAGVSLNENGIGIKVKF